MLPLETKQSGGKLLPHSDLRGVVFLGEASRKIHREMKLGTWHVRSLYRAGSLKAAARELARYKLDVVGVQEVWWDKEGTVTEEVADEVSNFCAPCNVLFFNILRSDNLLLNILRSIRIFSTIEYKKMTSKGLHLCAKQRYVL